MTSAIPRNRSFWLMVQVRPAACLRRHAVRLLLLLPLAGCAEPQGPASVAPALTGRQEAACTAVIAAHVRRPPGEVHSTWMSRKNGIALVEAVDGNRRHLCEVDGTARVLGYSHPGA